MLKQLTQVFRLKGTSTFGVFVLMGAIGVVGTMIEIYHTYLDKSRFLEDIYIWGILCVLLWLVAPLVGVSVLHALRKMDTRSIQIVWAVYLFGVLCVFAVIRGALYHYMQGH